VITLPGHIHLLLLRAFKDFKVVRDMAIGAIIAVITLALQVWWELIPLVDWQKHRSQWIASFVIPFFVILGGHVLWRLFSAPWRVHQDQESAFRAAIQEKEYKIQKQAIENEEVNKRLQEVLEKAEGPKILLTWDAPKEFAGLGIKRERLIIENASDIDAYHVKIEDVSIDQKKIVSATFTEINLIKRNSKETIVPRMIGTGNSVSDDDFEVLYESMDILPEYRFVDKGFHFVKFPCSSHTKNTKVQSYTVLNSGSLLTLQLWACTQGLNS